MKPLVSFADAKNLDKAMTASPYNISELELMESASRGIVSVMQSVVKELENKQTSVLILIGNDNNGMDALTIARYFLFDGYSNISIISHEQKSRQLELKVRQIENLCKNIYTYDTVDSRILTGFNMIIDGILGIGADRPIENFQFFTTVIKNNPKAQILSIDVPSGVFETKVPLKSSEHYTNIITAHHTFSIAPLKHQCYFPGFRNYCGSIHEIPLVFPASAISYNSNTDKVVTLLEHKDLKAFVPTLYPTSHKYDRGSVLIYGGSLGLTGAPLLAARGAESSGAGLVTLRVPQEVYPIIAGTITGTIIETASFENKRKFHAALCGPGWETNQGNRELFQKLWTSDLPLVVDASALHFITSDFLAESGTKTQKSIICTPHIGEMSKMLVALDLAPSYDNALAMASYDTKNTITLLAKTLNAVIVAKAASTWIAMPTGKLYVYDGCEPGLAVGGSGDVLAGIIVALLGRGASAEYAVCAAVIAHGMAGKKLASHSGFFEAAMLTDALAKILYGVSL